MKRMLLIPALAVALALGGCAGASKIIGFATTTVTNPVKPKNIYEVKAIFEGTQNLVWKYQRDCFGSDQPPYPVTVKIIKADPVLSVQCSHRVSRYNRAKVAEDRAFKAIRNAEAFIVANPTGNAISYISAAWDAVTDYRKAIGL